MKTKILLVGLSFAMALSSMGQALTTNVIKRTSEYPNATSLRTNDLIQIAQPDLGTNKNIRWDQLRAQIRLDVTNAVGTNAAAVVPGTNMVAVTNGGVVTLSSSVNTNAYNTNGVKATVGAMNLVTNLAPGAVLPNLTTTNAVNYGGKTTIATNDADNVLVETANHVPLITWAAASEQMKFNTNFPVAANGSTIDYLDAGNIRSGTLAKERQPGELPDWSLIPTNKIATTNALTSYIKKAGDSVSGVLTVSNPAAGHVDIGLATVDISGPVGGTNVHLGNDGISTLQPITYNNLLAQPGQFLMLDANKRMVGTNDGTQLTGVLLQNGGSGNSNELFNAKIVVKPLYLMLPFLFTSPNAVFLWTSWSGTNFGQVGDDPIANSYRWFAGSTTAGNCRDARVFIWRGKKYMSFWESFGSDGTPVGVLMESDNWIEWKTNSMLPPRVTGKPSIGPAQWFADPVSGRLYMVRVHASNLGFPGIGTDNQPYYSYLTNNADMTSFTAPVLMGGNFLTNIIDPTFFYWDNRYWCFAKQECDPSCAYITLFTSTNFITGWVPYGTNDWTGQWGVGYEGPQVVDNLDGTHSIYFERFSGGGYHISKCPDSGFPTNGWGPKGTLGVDWSPSDAAFFVVTNAVDIAQIAMGRSILSKSKDSIFIKAGAFPYHDNLLPLNVDWDGTNYQGSANWQTVRLRNKNQPGFFMNWAWNQNNDAQTIEIFTLDKTTAARTLMGTISKSGWAGNIGTQSTAPNPSVIGAGGGRLWVSNANLYYSWTANGVSSNGACLVAPAFHPTMVSGLKYYWDYHDAGISNTAVSSWVDRISGIALNQVDASTRPTGTVSGVSFLQNAGGGLANLTNGAVTISSNFTVWAVLTPHSTFSSAQYVPILGTISPAASAGFYGMQSTASLNYYFSGDHILSASSFFTANTTVSIGWANGKAFTNGITSGTSAIPTSYPLLYGRLGSEGPGQGRPYFTVKYFAIFTNTVSDADMLQLSTWGQAN